MISFWDNLPKPFFCLAPLADVTDPAFRRIIASQGMPDVMWTEFVSADGLFKGGYDALVRHLAYTEAERPLIAQFFSRDPELMARATRLAIELGFDGVDVNMGCPDQNVCKQGCGAAIIKEPVRAQEIVLAMKEASESSNRPIPVSVKTRIGYTENEIETWLPALLETKPAAITIHGRTRKEMSKVPAHWDVIKRGVEIRDEIQGTKNPPPPRLRRDGDKQQARESKTLIIGNGDVQSIEDGKTKAEQSGCDGVMLGRAIFGNPWLFANVACARRGCHIEHSPKPLSDSNISNEGVMAKGDSQPLDAPRPPLTERLHLLAEHIRLFDEFSKGHSPSSAKAPNFAVASSDKSAGKSFAVMKKHFKSYISGPDGDKQLVIKLMETKTAEEAIGFIEETLATLR